MSHEPVITFGIPCYNSAEYMDRCVESIVSACEGHFAYEVIIVDDGSTDNGQTSSKAQSWQVRYPHAIQVVHQDNGGHGAAVLTGLEHASGRYYRVVDSDDWLDTNATRALLEVILDHLKDSEPIDLYISNYVYEQSADDTSHVVDYKFALPQNRIFTWAETKPFRPDQNLLMHSLTYRTEVLRKRPVPLPHHTFYVDNIYAWVPLPRCDRMYYLDVDLYRYYIGRDDQSVNEQVMISRYDQQIKITRIMIDEYHLFDDVSDIHLREYMLNYLTMMMAASTIFGSMSEAANSNTEVEELWEHLKNHDERMYENIRHGHALGIATNLPGKLGKKITMAGYKIARKIFKFN